MAALGICLLTTPNTGAAQRAGTPPSISLAPLAAPLGVAVTPTNGGPQLSWQRSANATSYQVLRGSNASRAVIATLPAATLSYLDRGFTAATTYQVVAVAADRRTAASNAVSYTPASGAIVGMAGTLAPVVSTVARPTTTSIGAAWHVTIGDTIPVRGTGFGSISSVVLVSGCYHGGALGLAAGSCDGVPCYDNAGCRPDGFRQRISLTPLAASATAFSFVVPAGYSTVSTLNGTSSISLPPGGVLPDRYFLIVTNAGGPDTSAKLTLVTRR